MSLPLRNGQQNEEKENRMVPQIEDNLSTREEIKRSEERRKLEKYVFFFQKKNLNSFLYLCTNGRRKIWRFSSNKCVRSSSDVNDIGKRISTETASNLIKNKINLNERFDYETTATKECNLPVVMQAAQR